MGSKYMIVTIKMRKDLVDKLDELSKELGTFRASLMRLAIETFYNNRRNIEVLKRMFEVIKNYKGEDVVSVCLAGEYLKEVGVRYEDLVITEKLVEGYKKVGYILNYVCGRKSVRGITIV